MSEFCLTLLCPPAVEEKLLDLLLLSPGVSLFTSAPAAAHGLAAGNLSAVEQVLGRARATQIQVMCAAADKTALIEEIRRQFAGAGVRFWVTPVLEAGEFA